MLRYLSLYSRARELYVWKSQDKTYLHLLTFFYAACSCHGGLYFFRAMQGTKQGLPDAIKLLIGAGGIYAAFLYYGSLQEDVFRYKAADGTSFKQAWFLQVLEALANVLVGFIGMQLTGATPRIPLKMFAVSGAAQVTAKACTSLALANGLSFPVATLAKSGKMAPVSLSGMNMSGLVFSD